MQSLYELSFVYLNQDLVFFNILKPNFTKITYYPHGSMVPEPE